MKHIFYSREKAYREARKESRRSGMSQVIIRIRSSTFVISVIEHDGENTARYVAEAVGLTVVDRTFGRINP